MPAHCDRLCAVGNQVGADNDGPPRCFAHIQEYPELETKKVTVVVYPDEDGGYTAIVPYFYCSLVSGGACLAAQGWTAEEALAEASILIEGYLDRTGAEGKYHLEHARLEGLEVREVDVDLDLG